jgi:hypothetical protein
MIDGKKTWHFSAVCFILSGIALFYYGLVIQYRYQATLPRTEDKPSGHIFPLNIHGVIVFQTAREQNRQRLFEIGGFAIVMLGLATGGISEKKFKIGKKLE